MRKGFSLPKSLLRALKVYSAEKNKEMNGHYDMTKAFEDAINKLYEYNMPVLCLSVDRPIPYPIQLSDKKTLELLKWAEEKKISVSEALKMGITYVLEDDAQNEMCKLNCKN